MSSVAIKSLCSAAKVSWIPWSKNSSRTTWGAICSVLVDSSGSIWLSRPLSDRSETQIASSDSISIDSVFSWISNSLWVAANESELSVSKDSSVWFVSNCSDTCSSWTVFWSKEESSWTLSEESSWTLSEKSLKSTG